MGVKGLTPYLLKIYPEVFTTLPNRLQGLQGKKVVIDGTLITQRFHFAQNEHPYRHIQGWYRIGQELKNNGVDAICIFDGKERSTAKAHETERRQAVRNLTKVRGSIEQDRHERLQKLQESVELFNTLEVEDRHKVLKAVEPQLASKQSNVTKLITPEVLAGPTREFQPIIDEPLVPLSTEKPKAPAFISGERVDTDKLASQISSLNIDYQVSLAKLAAIATSKEMNIVHVPRQTDESKAHLLTRTQYDLIVQEQKVWGHILESAKSPVAELKDDIVNDIEPLVFHSGTMSSLFQRRGFSPVTTTYDESKQLLRAMGIPCIDATGPIEAEGLASSIVLNGLADYVVSEDTDVLVYDAPMIKNITSYQGPLTSVSAKDLRSTLQLDREAFVDFALLLGTDFTERIGNIGPMRAYQFIKKHRRIEEIVMAIKDNPKFKFKLPIDAYLAQIDIARLVFNTLPAIPTKEALSPPERNKDTIHDILEPMGLSNLLMDQDGLGVSYFGDNPS